MAEPGADGRLVDYERVARRYDAGRRLEAAAERAWQHAVRRRLPAGRLSLVLDVGAGTGAFLEIWRGLQADEIVAVEPSEAMRAQARRRAVDRAHVVGGSATHLPAATGSVDVVWMSAVVHHIPDLAAAAAEVRRVLRPGGRLLVRGFFPDASTVPWLDHLPAPERARARFPTSTHLASVLEEAALPVRHVDNVPEPRRATGKEAADWIAAMRTADSLLTAFDDDDIATGIAALSALGDTPLPPLTLTLLTAAVAVV